MDDWYDLSMDQVIQLEAKMFKEAENKLATAKNDPNSNNNNTASAEDNDNDDDDEEGNISFHIMYGYSDYRYRDRDIDIDIVLYPIDSHHLSISLFHCIIDLSIQL